jgi:DNA-binding IclR family transcriptional regulator
MSREQNSDLSVTGVASVERGLQVLTAFQRGDGALSLADLARRTGLVKSTVMRLAISLEQFGLFKKLEDGNYRLDGTVLRLASIYQEQIDLETVIVPALRRLVAETQETASFYVRLGDQRLCLFRVTSPHSLRLHIRPGDALPMDESSIAQVLIEFEGRARSDRKSALKVPLYTAGRRDPHTASLSTPVFGKDENLLGALAISGPITRLTAERAAGASGLLREVAAELTHTLGGYKRAAPALT